MQVSMCSSRQPPDLLGIKSQGIKKVQASLWYGEEGMLYLGPRDGCMTPIPAQYNTPSHFVPDLYMAPALYRVRDWTTRRKRGRKSGRKSISLPWWSCLPFYSATNWAAHFRASGIKDKRVVESLGRMCDVSSSNCLAWFRVYWAGAHAGFPQSPSNIPLK